MSDDNSNDNLGLIDKDNEDIEDGAENELLNESKESSPEIYTNGNDLESVEKNKEFLDSGGLLDVSSELEDNTSDNLDDKLNKRDETLDIRDELDFEEQKESGEESDEEENAPQEEGAVEEEEEEEINKEEGELSEEDEDESLLRQEPKTVCRFFNKGQCTWGTNCRFLHPGVSDKGNYNMFAPPKPQSQTEAVESSPEKEKPKEIRRYVPEPTGFETAWERGLRHAKEMKKRANKRKETDADFEEKRFNLSLGQAELDRENDYYTRPASPVYKPTDEVIEYLDPYEKQAIRHFRGGHFENLEVRYNVTTASYPNNNNNRSTENIRSRREKFDREVTDRIPSRRLRVPDQSPPSEIPKVVKEKRYPRQPRGHKEERHEKGEAEVWADPWARRKTPLGRMRKKTSRTRSYSSGSSSKSSRSSRSSSYSSYSSRSRSSSGSRSSSRSRSITPPVHPRQRAMNNRGGRQGMVMQQRLRQNPNQQVPPPQFRQAPNFPPNHPLAPISQRPPKDARIEPLLQLKQEPNKKYPLEESRSRPPVNIQRKADVRQVPVDPRERVDMFGRTIRKEPDPPSPKKKIIAESPAKAKGRRKYSVGSKSGSSSRSSKSRSRSRSSSLGSSVLSAHSPTHGTKKKTLIPPIEPTKKKERSRRLPNQGNIAFGDGGKSKSIDITKVTGPKQIKMTLKKQGTVRPVDRTVLDNDDDSGESDTEARIPKKRKIEAPAPTAPPPKMTKVAIAQNKEKKPSAARREELLKQLRAVEDAIARKRSKPIE